jgi:hypothetical protein
VEATLAVRADIVGGSERADHELSELNRLHIAADLDHDASILMAHVLGPAYVVQAAICPKVGPADAGRRELDDGVGALEDPGLGDCFIANVADAVENGG